MPSKHTPEGVSDSLRCRDCRRAGPLSPKGLCRDCDTIRKQDAAKAEGE